MKLKPIYFINSIVFASFLRFIIIPIEDYPDIINLYVDKRSGVLNSENWIGYFARLFRLDELFTSPCYVVRSSSIINDYFFGGGFYKCTSFPISIRYLSISLLLLSLIIIFFLFCYKLSYQLGNNQKIIFKKTLFFLLLLPATNYFLLMLHTDNLYNFLIDSLEYDDTDPWPSESDGSGPTLELLNPLLDNSLPSSWSYSADNGSPGQINTAFQTLSLDEHFLVPKSSRIVKLFPNPFNPTLTINFELAKNQSAEIQIHNILGQLVYSSPKKPYAKGNHSLAWNFSSNDNIGSGIFFVTLKTVNNRMTKKALFIK